MILTIVFRHETTLDELVVPFHYYFGQLRVFGCFTLVFTVEETVFLRPSNGEGTRLISFHRHRPSRVLSTRDAAKKEPQVHVLRAPFVPPAPALYSPPLPRDATPRRAASIAKDREKITDYLDTYTGTPARFERGIRRDS